MRSPLVLPILLLFLAPVRLSGQDAEGWNDPRALELIARAREVRQRTSVDSDLRSYQAIATGHVFFLVDRPNNDERTLIKADQIAIEVYWRAPRDTRQRIVGLRDQKVLPTNIRYHLDHLTVVQDDFGDQIRLGDGDEVSAVVHPVAPESDLFYEFRLADSLTISLGGSGGDVKVNEIQVRPRDGGMPGFVGSVFIDRTSAAIVRMTFTFTPASYVDGELDYIRISLDNSLWEGKWWLPYRQELEIRRELPALDFLVGSVIRGRFEIGDYTLNPELSPQLFVGNRVTQVTETERESYPFAEPLIPEADALELSPTPTLDEVRAQALTLMRGRYLSGLARLRLYLPTASEVFRWNRAEGAVLGFGLAYRPTGGITIQTRAGWSFGRGEPTAALVFTGGEVHAGTGLRLTLNERRDLGLFPGASDVLNTLAALTTDRDWTDPWFSSGVEAFHTVGSISSPVRLALRWDRVESGELSVDPEDARDFRPVRVVDEGDLASAGMRADLVLTASTRLSLDARAGRLTPADGGSATRDAVFVGGLFWERGGDGASGRLIARADGGVAVGDVLRQHLFLLGGAGTLLGQPYRAQVGDRFWLASLEGSRADLAPWVTFRAFAAAGNAWLGEGDSRLEFDQGASGDAGVRASVGGGVGLLWDVIHLDIGRGLEGGEWELVVSVDRRFQGWL